MPTSTQELTLDQQKALALGRARLRLKEQREPRDLLAGPWRKYQNKRQPRDLLADQAPKAGKTSRRDRPASADIERPPGVLRTADDFMRGAADTASGGNSDEIAARANSLLTGVDYETELARQRAIDATGGTARKVGQVVGGVLSAATLARYGMSPTTNATMSGKGALPLLFLSGAEGGYLAGGYGFGSGEGGIENRLRAARDAIPFGAIYGLGAGAFAPLAGGVVRWGTNKIRDFRSVRPAAKELDVSKDAVKVLRRSTEADDLGGAGMRNIREAGPDAMLADAGPASQGLLDVAIQKSGRGAVTARRAVEGRASAAQGRVTDAFDRSFGKPQGLQSTQRGIREGSAGARRMAYEFAYEHPIDYAAPAARELENLLDRVPQKVITNANQLMQLEGHRSKQILADIASDGTVRFFQKPDVRQLDFITRALREVADTNDGAGLLGGQTATGRAYANLAREIRDRVRTLVPAYGDALETAAEPIAQRQALLFGAKALKPGTTRDEVAETIRGMTGPERQAVMAGVRQQLDDAMANTVRAVSDGNMAAREATRAIRELSSRANREKLSMIMGQDQANALLREIDQATKALELRASVANNSRTFARQDATRAVDDLVSGGLMRSLARGEPIRAGQRAVQGVTRNTPAANLAREDRVYGEIVDALVRNGQAGPNAAPSAQTIAEVLMGMKSPQPSWAHRMQPLERSAAIGGTVPFAPDGSKRLQPLLGYLKQSRYGFLRST